MANGLKGANPCSFWGALHFPFEVSVHGFWFLVLGFRERIWACGEATITTRAGMPRF